MRNRLALGLIIVLLCLGVSSRVKAQVSAPAKTPTPDPAKILLESAAECLKVKTIRYVEEPEPSANGARPGYLTRATVVQARADIPVAGFLPGKFAVDGSSGTTQKIDKFAFSYDGAFLRVVVPDEKVVKVVKAPTAYITGSLLGQVGIVGLTPFTDEHPFARSLDISNRISYEGTTSVHGVLCHVVAVLMTLEYPGMPPVEDTVRWFIAVEDKLPRGISINGQARLVRILQINPSLTAAEFSITGPKDYGEQLITGKEPKSKGLLEVGSAAPDWTLSDQAGNKHALGDYKGKLVLLDFWGTWCVPCRNTMPSIQKIHDTYKDRGVAVIGIAVGDDEGNPAGFMKSSGFNYGLLLKGDPVATAYHAQVLPSLYLIGDEGEIVHAEFGYRQNAKEELTAIIERYLKAKGR
jgi:peroxiredoxin